MKTRTALALSFLALGMVASTAQAGSPWAGPWPWSSLEGSRRVDVIGPIGNRLPPSYRRQYNRPSYLGGKIAAKIEPSSQEAMAFHRADELGLYDNNGIKGWMSSKNCPPRRVEQHYFYPKPWEVLTVGPRRDFLDDSSAGDRFAKRDNDGFEKIESDSIDDTVELVPPVHVAPTDDLMELTPQDGEAE